MDFVARAGALMDKSHRVSGMLLFIIMGLVVILGFLFSNNQALHQQIANLNRSMPVYVVPGSTAAIYSPTSADILANAFADFMIQSLYTYTYENYQKQYDEAKKFFSSEMLRFADPFFGKRIITARNLKASEHFVPDRQSLQIRKTVENGEDIFIVTLRGSKNQIINGSVVQAEPIEFVMSMQGEDITQTNPFGLRLLTMNTRKIGAQ